MMFANKTILIAGTSSGIGRSVALQLARKRNRLIIFARRKPELEALAADIRKAGSEVLVISGDALSKEQAETAVTQAVNVFGSIDAALLNAGDGPAFNMSKTGVESVLSNMDLNYASMVNFLIPLIAQMKIQGDGLIAHTNSLAGFLGLPMQGPYSAAKAACRILLDTCRIELKPFGLRFVSAYPGFVATERVAGDGIPAPFEISEVLAAQHIIKAMEKEKADYLFPLVTASLLRLALLLPKPISGLILSKNVPNDY